MESCAPGERAAPPARIPIVDGEPAVPEPLSGSLEFKGYRLGGAVDDFTRDRRGTGGA